MCNIYKIKYIFFKFLNKKINYINSIFLSIILSSFYRNTCLYKHPQLRLFKLDYF